MALCGRSSDADSIPLISLACISTQQKGINRLRGEKITNLLFVSLFSIEFNLKDIFDD